jgi:methanogenic corrinoid protein MtbC1
MLVASGFADKIGRDNVCSDISQAVEKAKGMVTAIQQTSA